MSPRPSRRQLFGGAAGLAASCAATSELAVASSKSIKPVMVGSANALPGMRNEYEKLLAGGAPLDAAVQVCKVAEADPSDTSVGIGGIPNEDGVVQLDAACMDGRTHNSGAVAALENILHPIEVARLVMERTDHCQIFGAGAYRFAREHGFPHTELLTESTRKLWLEWREGHSSSDDRLPPRATERKTSALPGRFERHGTIHCSVLALDGHVACATSTSGMGFKIPGRVGDSAIVGAGLYCDDEGGSAGSTGRGEASILACASALIVEQLRQGVAPKDAGLEILRRIVAQTRRQALWQPELLDAEGKPVFDIQFYLVGLDGRYAGVTMHGRSRATFAVADPEAGPRLEALEPLLV